MKNLISTLRSSFYDLSFYEHIRTQELLQALKIFVILGALGTAVSTLSALPDLVSFAYSNLPEAIESSYPDDLIVKIENGEMSINKPEPYYIKNNLPGFDGFKYLAIFDGKDQLPEDLQQNSTIILFKNKYAIAPGQNHQEQIIPFSRVGTTTVEKSVVVSLVERFKPYFIPGVLGGGAFLFVFFTLFGTLFWVIFHAVYVLIPAVLTFLFTLVNSSKFTYRESYMVTLYASIPVAILFYLFETILGYSAPEYAYTLVLLLFVIFNITGKVKEQK